MTPDDEFLKRLNEQFGSKMGGDVPPEELEERRRRDLNEKEVKVMGVYEHPRGAFVLLRDTRGRALPIWIDQQQAHSIAVAIDGGPMPRPMTHDLLKTVIERLGGRVECILVDDLYNNTYYAKISVRKNGSQFDLDCRPSDALAIGRRAKVPIYVADHVMEEGQVEWSD